MTPPAISPSSPVVLSKWDFMLIDYLKRDENQSINGLKVIWAERNMVDVHQIHSSYIAIRMSEIIEKLGLATLTTMMQRCAPAERWKYGMQPDVVSDEQDAAYWQGFIMALGSILRYSEVAKLPGYREWIEAKDIASAFKLFGETAQRMLSS